MHNEVKNRILRRKTNTTNDSGLIVTIKLLKLRITLEDKQNKDLLSLEHRNAEIANQIPPCRTWRPGAVSFAASPLKQDGGYS